MKKFSVISLSALPLVAALALSACSESNPSEPIVSATSSTTVAPESSAETPVAPESSSEAPIGTDPLSSAVNPQDPMSSIAVPTEISSSSTEPAESCTGTDPLIDIPIDNFGFADIGDVFKSVRCNEKVVFAVRHAERDINDVSKEATITEDGVIAAQATGAKLVGGGDFSFSHTNFVRTEQTCMNISLGRGQANFVHDTVSFITGSWYVKDEEMYNGFMDTSTTKLNDKTLVSDWAYTGRFGEAFYDLKERSEEIISTYLAPSYEKMQKYHLVCTHDTFVLPMAVYLTDKKVLLKFHDKTVPAEKNWINYIAGVAIVMNDKNERRVYAVKGMDDGIY